MTADVANSQTFVSAGHKNKLTMVYRMGFAGFLAAFQPSFP